MTQPIVHIWRLLKWGRVLARHGALRGIERDPNTPPPVRRLARIARFGARIPKVPTYAEAFQDIGPAAIKFGQALATRPDLVGEQAARDLQLLQDSLPPAPFEQIRKAIELGLDRPIDELFTEIDPEPVGAASIAQVHRATTTDGRQVAIKVLRPNIEEDFARAIETYEWAAAQVEAMGGEVARLRPRQVVATFRRWTHRELDLRLEAATEALVGPEHLVGRQVAIKVLRPNIEEDFARAIETYEWAAAQVEAMGGEVARLRPRQVVATFRRWTHRELDLRLEAASASELRANLQAESGFFVPEIDWARTSRRVMTLEWIDGIKLNDRNALIAAGHDLKALAATLVRAFLRQAVVDGFFHADLHQGNLFALPDGRLAAIDFGIMGRIDRQARVWLAEILYGLITANYSRVAEIHFEAQYVPGHHNIDEFATALRAVGEPIRGLPVKEISIGKMLDGLFKITRDFDMPTQPHLLLLQKTMVMEEGVATFLDPDINMWETAEPFLSEWARTELGPEARLADEIVRTVRLIRKLPDLIRRIDYYYPPPGAAPQGPPLPDVVVIRPLGWLRYALIGAWGAVAGAAAVILLT